MTLLDHCKQGSGLKQDENILQIASESSPWGSTFVNKSKVWGISNSESPIQFSLLLKIVYQNTQTASAAWHSLLVSRCYWKGTVFWFIFPFGAYYSYPSKVQVFLPSSIQKCIVSKKYAFFLMTPYFSQYFLVLKQF